MIKKSYENHFEKRLSYSKNFSFLTTTVSAELPYAYLYIVICRPSMYGQISRKIYEFQKIKPGFFWNSHPNVSSIEEVQK